MSLAEELIQVVELLLTRIRVLSNRIQKLEDDIEILEDSFLTDHYIQAPATVPADDDNDDDAVSSTNTNPTIDNFLSQRELVCVEDEEGYMFWVPAETAESEVQLSFEC